MVRTAPDSATAATGVPTVQDDSALRALVGATVRVVARRGYTVEGLCVDVWRLRNGGTALKIRPSDGSSVREVTTLVPVVVLRERNQRRA